MRPIKPIILTLLLVAVTGCGLMKVSPVHTADPSQVSMIEDDDLGLVYLAPGFNLKRTDVLLVVEPSTKAVFGKKGIDPETMAIFMKQELVTKLSESGAFAEVTDDRSILSNANSSAGKVLVLEASFTELDPGNRALRYFAGLGAGRSKVQVESEIKDATTKQLYFKASNRMVGVSGGFGGDSEVFVLASLKGIAEAHGAFFKRITSSVKVEKD